MVSNSFVENKEYCRDCVSKCLNVELSPEDCSYQSYRTACKKCKDVRRIVKGVKLGKRISAKWSE